jgi:hypothetical protein
MAVTNELIGWTRQQISETNSLYDYTKYVKLTI